MISGIVWPTYSRSSRSQRSSSRGNCRYATTASIHCRSSATKLRYWSFVSLLNAQHCLLEWSKESLLQSWIDDPIRCCEISGVNPPLSILHERGLTTIDITHFDTVHLSKEVPCCSSPVSLLSFLKFPVWHLFERIREWSGENRHLV